MKPTSEPAVLYGGSDERCSVMVNATDKTQHARLPMSIPMSNQAFASWGIEALAYLKPEQYGDISGYVICAADGRHLAFAESQEIAKTLVVQNELTPVYVH